MTSFPVFRKVGITLKRNVLELQLHENADRKSGTAVQNHYSLLCRTPSCGEIVMTSFPVFIKLAITSKWSVLEQKLHRNTIRKLGLAVPNHILLFKLGDTQRRNRYSGHFRLQINSFKQYHHHTSVHVYFCSVNVRNRLIVVHCMQS